MPDEKNNPDRRSLGEGGCPSCADHPMGKALPGSTADVLIREYVPPTAAELEFSRNFYAAMEARTGRSPFTDGIPVQTQDASPGFGGIALRDGMMLPDISGLPMDPQGPAARSLRFASGREQAVPDTFVSSAVAHALSGQDVLMPSQLTAPWLPASRLIAPGLDTEAWEFGDEMPTNGLFIPRDERENLPPDVREFPVRADCDEEWTRTFRVQLRFTESVSIRAYRRRGQRRASTLVLEAERRKVQLWSDLLSQIEDGSFTWRNWSTLEEELRDKWNEVRAEGDWQQQSDEACREECVLRWWPISYNMEGLEEVLRVTSDADMDQNATSGTEAATGREYDVVTVEFEYVYSLFVRYLFRCVLVGDEF